MLSLFWRFEWQRVMLFEKNILFDFISDGNVFMNGQVLEWLFSFVYSYEVFESMVLVNFVLDQGNFI